MISKEDVLFGKVAIDLNLITARALEEANKERLQTSPQVRIGEYLTQKGYLYPWDIEEILAKQKALKDQQRLEHTPATLPSKDIISSSAPSLKQGNLKAQKVTSVQPESKALLKKQEKVIHPPAGNLQTPKHDFQKAQMPNLEKTQKEDVTQKSEVQSFESPVYDVFETVPVSESLKAVLREARSLNASDLHLCVGNPPFVRRNKQIEFLNRPVLSEDDTEELIFRSISEAQKRLLLKKKSLDFCMSVTNFERYRTSIYKQINGWEAVFRIIPDNIKNFSQLKLPSSIKKLTEYHQGLILVGGPSNSGKTTTLAAMLDLINSERSDHIITVEDPIEYIHVPKKCQITQRELKVHTLSFENSLKAALREDPDIIMIGEMRDKETMAMAISASETGHLVFGTMPTSSASRTISAVVDFFPPDQQGQIQSMISESLRGIICQQLIPNINNDGLEMALEILAFDAGISAIVRQNQLHQLISMMQTGKNKGMKIMDESIMELLNEKKISAENAYAFSDDKTKFERFINKGQG